MRFGWWSRCLLINCLWFEVIRSDPESWSAEVPGSVSALVGSCVVIPCLFSYSGPDRKASDLTGVWQTESHENIYHPEASKVSNQFRGRTSLAGDLSHKNCSLRIDHVRHSDSGPFMFRIEIKDYDRYSYKHSLVSISMKDSPASPKLSVMGEEVRSGEVVSASCSVSHSCPSDPPVLTWSHIGTSTDQSHQLTKGQWQMTSSLTFNPTTADHNKSLICTALYRGGKKARSLITLNVKYAPVEVKVNFEPEVKEGDSVELNCSSASNPAAHSYQWYSVTGALQSEGHTYTLERVSRHTEAIYCIATNTEGQASSSPVQLNIVYPPEIKKGSACTTDFSTVTCLCMVDSHPLSDIKWLLPVSPTTLPSSSVERHGSLTIVTLQGAAGFSDTVRCHASNSQGNSTISLTVPRNGKLMYVAIAISAFIVTVIAISVLIIKTNCGSSSTEQPETSMKNVNAMDVTCPTRKARKSTADGVYSNYETNQHVYDNMEAEEECDPYECVTSDDATYANV